MTNIPIQITDFLVQNSGSLMVYYSDANYPDETCIIDLTPDDLKEYGTSYQCDIYSFIILKIKNTISGEEKRPIKKETKKTFNLKVKPYYESN
jgi:hypothetical protein